MLKRTEKDEGGNNMKNYTKFLLILVLGIFVVTLPGCHSSSDDETAKTQIATVERGNLTLDITAAGNLALSTVQDLTFDLFYAKGTVGEVKVAVGDRVTKGETIASLDPTEWNDEILALEDALSTAQRNAITKQRALATAQRDVATMARQVSAKEAAVITAERLVTAKELAVQQAEIDVESANNTLYKITIIKEIQDNIDTLNFVIQYAQLGVEGFFGQPVNYTYWTTILAQAKAELIQAQQDMEDVLTGSSSLTSADVALQVAQAQLQIKLKQMALEDAKIAVEDAKTAVDDAIMEVSDAKEDLTFAQQDADNAQLDLDITNQKTADAQDSLDEAKAASPEIIAPFDGFITKVNVAGGDEVLNGTVVAQIADPNKFEADILVSEMDIPQVKVGSEATITLDAISGIILTANVTRIAPTATIQSGVVNYSVKVEVQSIRPVLLSQSANVTQQQVEESTNNGLPEDFTLPEGFTPPEDFESPFSSTDSPTTSQTITLTNEDFQLREGMTVTVSIIIASRTNVLLIPNGALTTEGTQSYVQVVSASGIIEKRAVKTGLSDWQYTEITDGLTEGEQIIVPLSTAATTTSTSSQGNIMFFGGRP
jgi:multidrug efflux pump subunit AcrA (membrane-fusion protein)